GAVPNYPSEITFEDLRRTPAAEYDVLRAYGVRPRRYEKPLFAPDRAGRVRRRNCEMRCRRVAQIVGVLVLLTLALTACARSEEDRCREAGGVWRGTFCEMPAR